MRMSSEPYVRAAINLWIRYQSRYLGVLPFEDEHEFPAEEQPLPPIDSPTTESPGYVTESDPEEDPEEYEDDETEDGPVDYPMNGGDDGDDDDGDSYRDDANDEDEEREYMEDEEWRSISSNCSTTVITADEPVFPLDGNKAGHSGIDLPPASLMQFTTALPTTPLPPLPPSLHYHTCLTIMRSKKVLLLGLPEVEDRLWVCQHDDAVKKVDRGLDVRVVELAELHERDTQDLYALLEDAQDIWDGGGGGPKTSREGLGSFDRIEPGDSSGASDPSLIWRPGLEIETLRVIRDDEAEYERTCRLSLFSTQELQRRANRLGPEA
ncbi:hypothetical protein Tco_1335963 [Tanacetum coccineum]